jgi:hypothetical protein
MSISFNARALQEADIGTPLEVLPPVLFNTFKHHAGALRARIAAVAEAGPAALAELGTRLAVLGTKLMDVYTGPLTPRDISQRIREILHGAGRLELDPFRTWVTAQGDYAVVPLEDGSRWVLRLGDEASRYVHLHPGRWSPATIRVRANVLKTAFLVVTHVRIFGGDPLDVEVINEVRREHLGLSPLGQEPEGELGLGAVIEVLRRVGGNS